ncbi:MAG TPA: ATP-binding cassette domain-containing protein [Streptosporangiaceae bacterium]|nr:ATP-binding cassette domain-containing protein [Streptosporangiaceae bacterium]
MSVTLLPDPADQPEDESGPATTAALPAADLAPVIELRGVRLRGIDLPSDLDLTVSRGELVTLTGPPKAGRSALLNVLGLIDRPAAGSYLLDGTDTGKLRETERAALRARQIGMVFAHKNLLPDRSLLDNVTLPLVYAGTPRRQRLAAGIDVLGRVGLTALSRLPASQLSGLQRALCAVGRALITRPGLLLCDDPTAGLDQAEAEHVIGLLAGLHREGRSVLIATAEQLAAAYSSKSVQLGPP